MKKISQREAHRLRARVEELELREHARRNVWSRKYPGGAHIGSLSLKNTGSDVDARIHVARLLKHAVVVVDDGDDLCFYALPEGTE